MAGVRNSGNTPINTNYFMGGATIDPKLGIANSFHYSRGFDFRSKPSQMSVLPAPRQLSNAVGDQILAMEQDLNGVRWGAGANGKLIKIDTSDTITTAATLGEAGSAGLLYNQVTDNLYIPGQTTVSVFGQVSGASPSVKSVLAQSSSIINGCTQIYNPNDGQFDGAFRSSAAASYAVPTALSETSGTYCVFSPDIEPGYSISVYIVNKGTGNWTLTLHDAANNTLATKTIANASLTSGAFNEFAFGSQVRVLVGGGIASGAANYHFHLTSTVNDGTVQVVASATTPYASGDMMSVNMLWSAYRLVQTNNGWHPTALFGVKTGTGNGQALCIGNGQYLATYNFSNDGNPSNNSFIRHQLVFKTGYEVCGISTNNQYLVIAVERRSKTAGRNFQDGALYFWDGTTAQPSFMIDIPMGAPYGLSTFNNITYFVVAGSLFAWSGGQTVIKVRQLAYQNTDYLRTSDHTLVNPNMFTSRYNLLMMGYPSSTTNPNIEYGVWSWGSVELTFPNSYGLSYVLSSGNRFNMGSLNLQIGCIYNFVDTMYISWQYTDTGGTHYGLDILDNNSNAYTNPEWQSLIYDGGARYKLKEASRLKVGFTPSTTACTLNMNYWLDRGSKQTVSVSIKAGDTNAVIDINKRYHEAQYGFDIALPTGLTANPLSVTGVAFETDPLESEVQVTQDG